MRYFLFLSLLFFSSKAFCANPKDFTINGKIISDLKFEKYSSQNQRNQFDDTVAKVRLFSSINLKSGFSIDSQIFLSRFDGNSELQRRQNSSDGGGDRFMENAGLILREFYLTKTGDNYTVSAGKFNLNFLNYYSFSSIKLRIVNYSMLACKLVYALISINSFIVYSIIYKKEFF